MDVSNFINKSSTISDQISLQVNVNGVGEEKKKKKKKKKDQTEED